MIVYPYKILQCGFYRRGQKRPLFGQFVEWMGDFVEWVHARPNVQATATFHDEESSVRSVYCSDAFLSGDHGCGMILWNELPSMKEGVPTLAMDSKVGKAAAKTEGLDENSLPGWPSYFWFYPSHGAVVSIVPDNMLGFRSSGIAQLKRYLGAYLSKRSRYAIRRKIAESASSKDVEIIRWQNAGRRYRIMDLSVRFDAKEIHLPGPIETILERCEEIRKLVISSRLDFDVPNEFELLERVLSFIGADSNEMADNRRTLNFRSEMDWTPTRMELAGTIKKWERDVSTGNGRKIGVKFRNDQKTYWFGDALGRQEMELDEKIVAKVLWDHKRRVSETMTQVKDQLHYRG